ncbi:MAG: hypothetical protein ACQEXQ_22720 [Bacillota bacterium]
MSKKLKIIFFFSITTILIAKLIMSIGLKDDIQGIEKAAFINKFQGLWVNASEKDIYLSLGDGIEHIGVIKGQLLTKAEYEVAEVNLIEQHIIIHGFSKEISYDEETKSEEFLSKLYLIDDDEKLIYVHDYQNKKVESTWTR